MKFTYETGSHKIPFETFEWDNVWFDHYTDLTKPRVLIIGDSISGGTLPKMHQLFGDRFYADNFATSKAVDNPFFLRSIDLVIEQEPRIDVIQFNNGLHGWHLDTNKFGIGLRNAICHIREKCPDTKIIIALSTPVRNKADLIKCDPRTETVIKRNRAAVQVADEFGLDVTDLFSATINRPELWSEDGVHFNDEGYEYIARKCAENYGL